jgi:hypothetical protein
MSLLFITVNDFIGEVNLDLSSDTDVVDQFESLGRQVEDDILRDLLNDKLYNDLIADLDVNGDPQTQIYIDLVDGKTYQRPGGETVNYDGLKRMLKYFVYEQYLDFTYHSNISVGQSLTVNENSELVTPAKLRKVRGRIQNKAVNLYNKAIVFIDDNEDDYFSDNDYGFWKPVKKKYLGKITTQTVRNDYYYNRHSESDKFIDYDKFEHSK